MTLQACYDAVMALNLPNRAEEEALARCEAGGGGVLPSDPLFSDIALPDWFVAQHPEWYETPGNGLPENGDADETTCPPGSELINGTCVYMGGLGSGDQAEQEQELLGIQCPEGQYWNYAQQTCMDLPEMTQEGLEQQGWPTFAPQIVLPEFEWPEWKWPEFPGWPEMPEMPEMPEIPNPFEDWDWGGFTRNVQLTLAIIAVIVVGGLLLWKR